MNQQGAFEYNVDVIMCIDATRSMVPFLDEVKKKALGFYPLLCDAMNRQGMSVEHVRVKVIAFRDYSCDDQPMLESEFYSLPEDDEAFHSFLAGIKPIGGGDYPENSLEAIALALKSRWTTSGDKRRHVIVVFTDDAALPLGDSKRVKSSLYPAGMPKTLEELGDWWAGYSQELGSTYEARAGRMVIYAPEKYPWDKMPAWERVWIAYSDAGNGLSEVEMKMVVDLVAHTIEEV